ncbi:MAG: carboxypeptidase-like regulatory domain-containing protein [Acidobacteriota bacterium]
MPRGWKYILLALSIMLLGSVPLAMQSDTGSIAGTVVDQRGPVENASVEARNAICGAQGGAVTDASGRFRIDGLRQGRYSMWVRAANHESVWLAQVIVTGVQTATRDVYLRELTAGFVPTAWH